MIPCSVKLNHFSTVFRSVHIQVRSNVANYLDTRERTVDHPPPTTDLATPSARSPEVPRVLQHRPHYHRVQAGCGTKRWSWAYVADATVPSIHKDLRHAHASVVFASNTSLSRRLGSRPCALRRGAGTHPLGGRCSDHRCNNTRHGGQENTWVQPQ